MASKSSIHNYAYYRDELAKLEGTRTRRSDMLPKVSGDKIDDFQSAKRDIEHYAKGLVETGLQKVNYSDIATARNEVITLMDSVLVDTTDATALVAAEFYDTCREAAGLRRMGAIAYNKYDPVATDKAVRGMIQSVIDHGGDPSVFNSEVVSRVGYTLKRASCECLYANGKRDNRRMLFEWTTRGSDACYMCKYLESVGAVSYTDKLEHYHDHCRCEPVPVWTLRP